MTRTKIDPLGSAARPQPRATTEGRVQSHVRFKPPVRRDTPAPGSRGPSTLPPPPFQSEAEVAGLEWWLESHMTAASNLLCLEQVVDAMPQHSGLLTLTTWVRTACGELGELRDALYEVYCDAADARMEPIVARGTPLGAYVKRLYGVSEAAVEAILPFAASLRGASTSTDALRAQIGRNVPPFDEMTRAAVAASMETLSIDIGNPVEPLRNVRKDVHAVFDASRALAARLAVVP